jgi:hypothetical protein
MLYSKLINKFNRYNTLTGGRYGKVEPRYEAKVMKWINICWIIEKFRRLNLLKEEMKIGSEIDENNVIRMMIGTSGRNDGCAMRNKDLRKERFILNRRIIEIKFIQGFITRKATGRWAGGQTPWAPTHPLSGWTINANSSFHWRRNQLVETSRPWAWKVINKFI